MARIGARSGSTGSFHCALAVGAGWPRRLLVASPALIGVAGLLAAVAWMGDEIAATLAATLVAFTAAVAVSMMAWRRRVRNLPASATDHQVAAAGLLRIAPDGHIWWQADGCRVPLQLLRWYAGRRVTWIRASVSPGATPLGFLLWRTAADDAAWRKLRAWLVWRERGGSRT